MSSTTYSKGNLKALVVFGGHSTRMGTPKSYLPFPISNSQTIPLYAHLYNTLRLTFPASHICFSLRFSQLPLHSPIPIEKDQFIFDKQSDIGPAAGLLAAYESDPNTSWFAIAVDFVGICKEAVEMVVQEWEQQVEDDPGVIVYENEEGFAEPLFGIWTPAALRRLKENVAAGKRGPSWTIKELGGKRVRPAQEKWVMSVNTPEEWRRALQILQSDAAGEKNRGEKGAAALEG